LKRVIKYLLGNIKMKIKVEKKLLNGEIIKTEELFFNIPKAIFDELNWEDGTVVEWEVAGFMENDKEARIVLRNIDDNILE
tara:strand:+ start:3086 stop:3328 length:243 start_codon:yes stop_codon:yes gene_type:complete